MQDQLKVLLIITFVALFLIILWAISIGVTYWDVVSRRKLTGIETAAWIALVVLIPGIGFFAYLFARLLEAVLSPGDSAGMKTGRVTMLRRQPMSDERTGTMLASDGLEPTSDNLQPPGQTSAVLDSSPRKYTLTVIEGPYLGVEYVLESFPIQIGRGQDVSIPLDDDHGVSRHHAEIYEQAGVLRIRDLKSLHGTRVNDSSINDKTLGPGDRIRVGMSILKVGSQELV